MSAIAQTVASNVNKDGTPILLDSCVSRHREGEIGPMSLTSYVEAAPFAGMITHSASNRIMRPWGADPAIPATPMCCLAGVTPRLSSINGS